MTRSKKLRVLREIYAEMPEVHCKGLCVDSCTTIPVFEFELEQMEAAAGRRLDTQSMSPMRAVALGEIGRPCPLLVMGRCGVYEARPIICRAYGAVEGLRCPNGCGPARPVTDKEQFRLFERVEAL